MADDESRRWFLKQGMAALFAQALGIKIPESVLMGLPKDSTIYAITAERKLHDIEYLVLMLEPEPKVHVETLADIRKKRTFLHWSINRNLIQGDYEDAANCAGNSYTARVLEAWRDVQSKPVVKQWIVGLLKDEKTIDELLDVDFITKGLKLDKELIKTRLKRALTYINSDEAMVVANLKESVELAKPHVDKVLEEVKASKPTFANIIRASQQLSHYRGEDGEKLSNFNAENADKKWQLEVWEVKDSTPVR